MLLHLSAFLTLFGFWLLLSGYFTPFLMTMGALSALAVVLFARRMDMVDREGHPIRFGVHLVGYWLWLLKEIAKSAWQVSRIIVHPALPISPTLVTFKPTQRTAVGLVVHANSITLTPGTIAVDVEPDRFLVHALTRDGADGCASGDMDARVSRCEART